MKQRRGDTQTSSYRSLRRRVPLSTVAARLDAASIRWAIFAGAAVNLYASGRPTTDIDILTRLPAIEPLVPIFPEGQLKPHEDGGPTLIVGDVELVPDLILRAESQSYPFILDEEMFARRVWRELHGVRLPVVSPEDNVVFKAILQRGPEQGKHDLEDLQSLLDAVSAELDWDYVRRRAALCGGLARVRNCLARLGIQI
jgi:hypothetical protein